MAISSNSIIHFTNSKEALKSILEDNFKVHYCIEKIVLGAIKVDMAVPMVSFCDISLSQVKEHMDKYGKYGIGLTKEWAIKEGLNPVLYLEKNSNLSKSIINFYKEYITDRIHLDKLTEYQKQLFDILRHTKNYQNDLVRQEKTYKDYRYYDEREWRYVLKYTEDHQIFHIVNGSYDKENANNNIKKHRLKFTPNDIKYIIIEDDTEINEFIRILQSAKGRNFSYEDVEKLTTRIITSKQIMDDF